MERVNTWEEAPNVAPWGVSANLFFFNFDLIKVDALLFRIRESDNKDLSFVAHPQDRVCFIVKHVLERA